MWWVENGEEAANCLCAHFNINVPLTFLKYLKSWFRFLIFVWWGRERHHCVMDT